MLGDRNPNKSKYPLFTHIRGIFLKHLQNRDTFVQFNVCCLCAVLSNQFPKSCLRIPLMHRFHSKLWHRILVQLLPKYKHYDLSTKANKCSGFEILVPFMHLASSYLFGYYQVLPSFVALVSLCTTANLCISVQCLESLTLNLQNLH